MSALVCAALCLLLLWALLRPLASDSAYVSEHAARVAAEASVASLQATVVALKPPARCGYTVRC